MIKRWGGVIILLATLPLLLGSDCGGGPGPGPDPTPTPDGPKYLEMLLRADGPSRFVTVGGDPVEFRGAISCCMPNDWGGDSGWPFNVHPEWQDYAASRGGASFFHGRLGPFMAGEGAEPEWAGIGGPYALAPDGRADLTRWNNVFWETAKDYVEYAAERGRYVEIDIIDGWYCKHGVWGDVRTPWMAAFNIQGEHWVGRCGSEAIQPGTAFDIWIKKVVTEFGPYGNVIWEDGNEIGQTQGYTPEWSLSMRDLVRQYEAQYAYNVVHLFGTNSHNDTVQANVDYIELHGNNPASAPYGKITMVNEYNPRPPFSATQMRDKQCFANAAGTFWWYWRHEQSLAQMEQTLAAMKPDCGGCSIPPANDPNWQPNPELLPTQLWSQYRQALENTGDRCGKPPEETLALVAQNMTALGVCASGPWGDAVIARRPDGKYEEWHAVFYGNGCTIATSGAYKGTWLNTSGCLPVPASCGAKFDLAAHWSGAIDSTYTVTSCCDYCKAIGMGEYNGQPRCGCPILPEGHVDRPKCEKVAIGQQRWFCNGQELGPCGDAPCITDNPAQAYCSGHVRTCTEDLSHCSEGNF